MVHIFNIYPVSTVHMQYIGNGPISDYTLISRRSASYIYISDLALRARSLLHDRGCNADQQNLSFYELKVSLGPI